MISLPRSSRGDPLISRKVCPAGSLIQARSASLRSPQLIVRTVRPRGFR